MSVWTNAKAAGKQPFPRSYHTATELNGKIYIYGGKDENGNPTDTTLYLLNTGMFITRCSCCVMYKFLFIIQLG